MNYSYQYDGAKRITGAAYAGAGGENYTLSGMSYDRNGNILSLNRAGTAGVPVDQLTYTYAQGNSLTAVSDASGNTAGFADGNTSGADYTYWPEGSIKKDLNRGISDVQYNLLKLPSQVSFTSGKIVRYQYDAGGSKLKMSVVNGEVRDYVGAFQYLTPGGGSRSLFEISTEEGRYTPVSGYEYYHRDHLGNVRAVQGQSGVSQWTDYDPWGLELSGLSSGSSTSRAKFNGQEAIAEIGAGYLDFGARGYDATIGRWGVVDPLAEVSRRWSPFVFGYNNPVRFVDPDGMNGVDTQKTSQDVQYTDGYGSYSLAGSSASLQLSGTYQSNGGGGEQQGGTEQGGPGPKPKGSTPSPATNERNYANFQEQTKNLGPELMQTLGAIWNFAMGIPEQSDPNIQNATVPMPFFMGGGSGKAATTLFRAVSKAELDDIARVGLRTVEGYETGKLFAPTIREATAYGRNNYFAFDKIPNHIIKVTVPNSVMSQATRFEADGMNAVLIPSNQLHKLFVKPLNSSPLR